MPKTSLSLPLSFFDECPSPSLNNDGRGGLDVVRGLRVVLGEVLVEQRAQLLDLVLEALGAGGPRRLGVEQLVRHARARLGHLQVEHLVRLVLDLGQLARVDRVQDRPRVLERAPLAPVHVARTDPPRVQQPRVGLVVLDLVRQHLGVPHRVQRQERLREARRERRLRLRHPVLRARHLGRVARDEVEHGLRAVELRDGG